METMYIFILITLAILAVTDLIVGVSNDAVNFLNSAIGSKAISFKRIMIIVSVNILGCGIFKWDDGGCTKGNFCAKPFLF